MKDTILQFLASKEAMNIGLSAMYAAAVANDYEPDAEAELKAALQAIIKHLEK